MNVIKSIYRGGVEQSTPTIKEIFYQGSDAYLLPGTIVALDEVDGYKRSDAYQEYWYITGRPIHGQLHSNLADGSGLSRLYVPRMGDLYAVRAEAGINLTDDMPLTVNEFGRAVPLDADNPEPIFFVDLPVGSSLRRWTTKEDELIPIKTGYVPWQKAGDTDAVDAGIAFGRIAKRTMSALRVVWEDENGKVDWANPNDSLHVERIAGITYTAGDEGDEVMIRRTGAIEDSSWNFTTGRVWLGENGLLTQIPPTTGYDVVIGVATTNNRMYVNIQDPILL